VARFAREQGLGSVEELRRWSIERRGDFWSAVARRIGFDFRHEGDVVLDDSRGPHRARWWPDASLNVVDSCFANDSDRLAVIHRRGGRLERVTYGQLRARVATALPLFTRGESVGLIAPMTLDAVVAYLAIIAAGGRVVSVAESFSSREIRRRLEIGEARRVVTQDVVHRAGRVLPLYQRITEAGAEAAIVIRTEAGHEVALREGDVPFPPAAAADDGPGEDALTTVAVRSAEPMHVLFSSGTTGDPKAIPWTHLTPLKGAMDAHLHFDVGAGDVLCWPTGMGWMMGPWLVFASMLNGAALALYDDVARGRAFGAFVRDAGVTFLGVVPSLVSDWRASRCMAGLDWSTIRRYASTGEASDPTDVRYLSTLAGGKPVLEYIGGTEIGGGYLVGSLVAECWPSEFTLPAFGLDVVLVDQDGRPSDEGEAFLVPPSVGLSTELLNGDHDAVYHEGVPMPGLRRHGDAFARTERSTYRALGRTDDTMNLGGIKVSSREIEDAVRQLDDVQEVAAVSWSGGSRGAERLALYVVPAVGVEKSQDAWQRAAQAAVSTRLNPLFRVALVRTLAALPRTASNKVMRRALRARLASEESDLPPSGEV
jgi:acetyl-CoA synthetase